VVHSSVLPIATDNECLTGGGFSLDKTVHFGSLEFIVDCFGSLSLSPKGSNSGPVLMGSTHSWSPSLRPMTEDSTKEFYMASSGEGGSGLPSSPWHSTGAPSVPLATTPWLEDILVTQAMTTVPLLHAF
jgi:hypothetical protein